MEGSHALGSLQVGGSHLTPVTCLRVTDALKSLRYLASLAMTVAKVQLASSHCHLQLRSGSWMGVRMPNRRATRMAHNTDTQAMITMRPDMITQIIPCACTWKFSFQRLLDCTRRSQKVPYGGPPQSHKNIPARKPCVTYVLCSWAIYS